MGGLLLTVDGPGGFEVVADGVVFDLDGVLVESSPCWEIAERRAVSMLGGTWPASRVDVGGRTSDVAAALLAPACGLTGRERELERTIEDVALEVFAECVVPIAGARRVLDECSTLAPIAVATNSPRRLAETSLAAAGLGDVFDAVITVDEVPVGKPAPDTYIVACEDLGLDPVRTLAIDDSHTGLSAARAAGLLAVAFGSGDHAAIDGVVGRIDAWASASFVPAGASTSASVGADEAGERR